MDSLPTTPTKQTMPPAPLAQGRSFTTSHDLAEFGADNQARRPTDIVFGFSNQKNRRARRARRSSFDAPKADDHSPTSSISSSASIICPPTPSPSVHRSAKQPSEKKSFFNLKNASTPNFRFGLPTTPSPPRPSGPIGLGINMSGTPPIPASYRFASPSKKGLRAQPVSRLFKVGKGAQATFFEPVPITGDLPSPSATEDSFDDLAMTSAIENQEDEDSSDDEFVSFQDSYENLISSYMARPEVQTSLGPSNLAELMALRVSTQAIYVEAMGQAGPSKVREPVVKPSTAVKRLPRKAVPTFIEAVRNIEPEVSTSSAPSTPDIPMRVESLPSTPSNKAGSQHSRTSSGESTGSSASSFMDDDSRNSLCSSVSTLASPMSESGSMPVTPLTAAHSPAFFAKEQPFELDVASVFFPHSPPHHPSQLDLELATEKDDIVSPNKSFYQNQAATQSSWAIITSKFKHPSGGQEKTRFRRFFGKSS